MRLRKPVPGTKLVGVTGTIGNEGVVVEYTIMRVDVEIPDEQTIPEWYVPFQVVKESLVWIRTAARQYWLGTLTSHSNSLARGSIISEDGTYTNFGAVQMPIGPTPLTRETWDWIGKQIVRGRMPPIPDVLFCDALISFRENDFMQTTIRLGITAELELNAFIDDLLELQNQTVCKLYEASRFTFDWKSNRGIETLGAASYKDQNPTRAGQLLKLYQLRGSAVHRAECLIEAVDKSTGKIAKVPVGFQHVSDFIFAVDDFLHWTKLERARIGLTESQLDSRIKYMLGPAT